MIYADILVDIFLMIYAGILVDIFVMICADIAIGLFFMMYADTDRHTCIRIEFDVMFGYFAISLDSMA